MYSGPRRANQSVLKEISPEYSLADAEAETPIHWPDGKYWFIRKDLDAGKDWRQEYTGMTEDEMVGWHHRLGGHGFWWTPEVGDGQGSPESCNPWGCKESDTTEWLKWTELNWYSLGKGNSLSYYLPLHTFLVYFLCIHFHIFLYCCIY